MRLTNSGPDGVRWSPDRTVRVTAHYRHGQHYDRRARPTGYTVADVLEGVSQDVATIPAATELAQAWVQARPTLDWSAWVRDPGAPPARRGAAHRLLCTANSPGVGAVMAWADLVQDPIHRGMWAVGYTMEGFNGHWLSSIQHIPHRLAFVRAHAAWRTLNRGEPLE